MNKKIIETLDAPKAIGPYSKAVLSGGTLYISGQIALCPHSMQMAEGIEGQIRRVFANLKAILAEASMGFENVVKLTIYLTEMSHFSLVNEVMEELFAKPYPARAAIGVASLPRAALVEVDAIAVTAL